MASVCNNFGSRLDQSGTQRVVDAALEAGLDFFDTADVYGQTRSEEYLGRALGARRRQVVIASKFGMPLDAEHQGARPEYVRRAVDDSLRRLGTDYIDLYQLHRPDPEVPIADTLGALDQLVRAGKVREIGCSNFSVEQLDASVEAARRDAYRPFVSVQNEFSLLARDAARALLPALERGRHRVLALLFTGQRALVRQIPGQPAPEGTRLSAPDSRLRDRFLSDPNLALAAALEDYARARHHSLLELAFSWLLSFPSVASVIAGASHPEQVKANAAAASWRLSDEERAAIDRVLALESATSS